MLNQLQRGNEPALLPCHHSVFLRRPYVISVKNRHVRSEKKNISSVMKNISRHVCSVISSVKKNISD
jgi:hypothetical protein